MRDKLGVRVVCPFLSDLDIVDSIINTSFIVRKVEKKKEQIGLIDALELLKKTELHTNGLRHIEFQDEEYGIHPRSLEEAIMNVNRSKFGISKEDVEVNFGNEKKTDFALKLLMEPQYADYTIPSYIVNGLIWLNQQAKMPKKKMPTRKYKRKYHKK